MFFLLRPLSVLLGLLDYLYFYLFLKPSQTTKKFFHEGYGNVEASLALRDSINETVPKMLNPQGPIPEPALVVTKELAKQRATLLAPNESSRIDAVEGSFLSPASPFLPSESKICTFKILRPPKGVKIVAVCVMLPATADMGTSLRRRLYGDSLALQGVLGIVPTAPFYGRRKPASQHKWNLQAVQDSFTQAYSVALETACLLHWARTVWGVPLAVTGVSFGGAMAALASKLYPEPLAIVPYMGCLGPGEPFAHGLFKGSVDWSALENVPEHPRVPLPHQAPGAEAPSLMHRFEEYCDFFTSTQSWEQHIPASMSGRHVLLQLQSRDDHIVSFSAGTQLYTDISRLAQGTHEHLAEEKAGEKKRIKYADEDEVLEAELMELVGGHVSGFFKCPMVLPAAVLRALARLQELHLETKVP